MSKGFTDYSAEELAPLLDRAFDQSYNFQRRRHLEWDDNYSLYRGKVKTNIFLQRQTVCLPIMKSTVKTVLSKTSRPPVIKFSNKDNDKDKEIFMNGVWEDSFDNKLNGLLVDTVDKKHNALYGRGIKTFFIKDGQPIYKAESPYNILIDKDCDPINIDSSAQFLIHINIEETVSQIEANEWYDQTEVKAILAIVNPLTGTAPDITESRVASNQRLNLMGYSDDNLVATSKIERRDFFVRLPSKYKDGDVIYFIPAICNRPIACIPLEEAIGRTIDDYWDSHFPIDTWADDVDSLDVWSDSVADIARGPNKLMNAWWSQEVENRTLKNYSMFFYNSSSPDFIPQSFNPYAWGFYPVPGNPNELMQQIPIPDLTGTLDQIAFVKTLTEQATAATATMQGQLEKSNVTLGEVSMALSNAQERIQSMAPYYTQGWRNAALKFYKLIEAGANAGYLGSITLGKTGARGNYFLEDVKYKDLITRNGYDVLAQPADTADATAMDDLQKLNMSITVMPENPALKRIYKEKLLETIDCLSAVQINEIKQAEEQVIAKATQNISAAGQSQLNPTQKGTNESIGQSPQQIQ